MTDVAGSFRLVITAVLSVAWLAQAHGQAFKPYPVTRITEAQWTSYFTEVRSKHADSMQEQPTEKLIVFSDHKTQTSYAFTQPGHPAHPAWITRQVVEAEGGVAIRQIGYSAGDQVAFGALYRSYQELNERIREFMQRELERTPSR